MNTPDSLPQTGDHVDIGGYLAKALDPVETERVEEHLAECETCRTEVDSLRQWADALETAPEAMLLDGPPEGGDLLLRRTLRQVRAESTSDRNRRRAGIGAAAAAVVAAAISAGVAIGHTTGQPPAPQAGPAPSATASTAAPGTRFATAFDPTTGARITVSVTPQTGWVRVTAAISGIPAGERCQLFVVGKDGTEVLAGSWVVSAKGAAHGTTLDGSALIDPAEVTGVRVSNTDGKSFASASL